MAAPQQSALPRPVVLEQSSAPTPSAIPRPSKKPEQVKKDSCSPSAAEITSRLEKVKLDAHEYWTSKPSPHEPCKFHLRIIDVSSQGARDTLRSIDYGAIIGDYAALVLRLLYDRNQDQPGTRSVTLVARAMPGVAFTKGIDIDNDHKEIHLSTDYIASTGPELRMLEVHGVLVHELVHCYQWDAQGTAPVGLTEGIADWVRLNCGLSPPHWKRRADGDWDVGYEGTGYFLDYLEERFGRGTVRRINQRMKCEKYEERPFWNELFGCSVLTLWEDYRKSLCKDGSEKEEMDVKRSRGATSKPQVDAKREQILKEDAKDEKENDGSRKSGELNNQQQSLEADGAIRPTPTSKDEEGNERWSWVPVPSPPQSSEP